MLIWHPCLRLSQAPISAANQVARDITRVGNIGRGSRCELAKIASHAPRPPSGAASRARSHLDRAACQRSHLGFIGAASRPAAIHRRSAEKRTFEAKTPGDVVTPLKWIIDARLRTPSCVFTEAE